MKENTFETLKAYIAYEKLAEEYGLHFVPLQNKFNEVAKKYGVEPYLYDGVHPMVAGANLIAEEWVKIFKEKIEVDK